MKQPTNLTAPSDQDILRGAILSGVINGIINGAIQLYLLWEKSEIPLSVDGITNDQTTVLGAAVPLAVSLAMILTVVTYFTLKAAKKEFWPDVFWLTIRHGVFAFGLCVAGAVVWQRTMGSIPVSLTTAVIVLGVVAGLAGGIVNNMTIRASVQRDAQ